MVSLLIVVVIAVGAWGLLRDSLNLSLGAVPAEIDAVEVEKFLLALPGVTRVHRSPHLGHEHNRNGIDCAPC